MKRAFLIHGRIAAEPRHTDHTVSDMRAKLRSEAAAKRERAYSAALLVLAVILPAAIALI